MPDATPLPSREAEPLAPFDSVEASLCRGGSNFPRTRDSAAGNDRGKLWLARFDPPAATPHRGHRVTRDHSSLPAVLLVGLPRPTPALLRRCVGSPGPSPVRGARPGISDR